MNNHQFGYSIAASNGKLLVGQFQQNTPVYLFDTESGDVLLTLASPVPGANDSFGAAVAFIGDKILVGAPAEQFGPAAGSAYLFDGTTGNLLQTFKAPPSPGSNGFGHSVSAWGNNVLIGAPFDDKQGANAGAAYVFDSTTGSLLDTYFNPTGGGGYFGAAVASLSGNALISAGAYATDNDGGAVFGFSPTHKLTMTARNPNATENTSFGFTPIGTIGSDFAVGAWSDNSVAITGGIAYSFTGPLLIPEPSTLVLAASYMILSRVWRRRMYRNFF